METSQYNCSKEPLKTTLSSSEINRLENIGNCISVPTNYVLVHAGDAISHCYFIKEGRILACEYTETGEKRIYTSFEKKSLVMEEYLLTGQICQIEYMTAQPSELIQIDRDILFHIIDTDPVTSKCIMRMMAEKLLFSEELFRHEKNKSATWKICGLFIEFADRYGVADGNRVMIQEKFSQQLMADILGMNRITIVREIKNLKEEKLIDKIGGYYYILDMKKLQQYQKQHA